MSALRGKTGLAIIWLCFVGGYGAVSLLLRPGSQLTAFADVAQCIVLLFANAGLLLNAASPDWRRNSFWMLLGMGCGMWLSGQLLWTYFEVLQQQPVPDPFLGDVIFFLHTVPLLGALALRPHAPQADRNLRFGHVDFQLLLSWWVYLYLFIVIPWQYVVPDVVRYGLSYNRLYSVENFTLVAVLGYLVARTSGPWRRVYAHLMGAALTYALSSMVIIAAIDRGAYSSGSYYDLPLVASFVWFGMAGIVARRVCPPASAVNPPSEEESSEMPAENNWPARMAMAAALSLPALALWSETLSSAPPAVRRFRLLTTLAAMVVLSSLIFLRQRLVDEDRLRLLRGSKDALVNLRRIQSQYVQAEKLASVGQLAAGAAHEINNPLTAILGYSDVLLELPAIPDRARDIAQKIREQARRTKEVISKLLSFAQPQPTELTLLDLNSIVGSVVELRRLDLLHKNIKFELDLEKPLPGIRGDANQLLQVFFNIIGNAVDAMEEAGGGLLTVRTIRDHRSVVIEFSDTGPGIRDPGLAFDPFYTTKPVGKGTGLGLSICYGLVKEHKGRITCGNRPGGGAIFRIELPSVMAMLTGRNSGATPAPVTTRLS
ncbi:MAG TPA: HAMP domain-containing sensor histidine kinase [Candidatus Acidoferrales bacterium]|nr:HAMP domain-containing sensor histidine kinase [Candidatus Acidoferrales bacterium]